MLRTRSQLGRALDEARHSTDCLFPLIRPDSLYDRPIAERHRIIFYLGHLEAFDWNLLARHALDVPAFHADFDKLFAFGIDPPPGQLPDDTPAAWPGIAEVQRYNLRTREIIDELLPEIPEQLLPAADEAGIELGMEFPRLGSDLTGMRRASFTQPFLQAAVQHLHVAMPKREEHPPRSRGRDPSPGIIRHHGIA